MNPVSCHALVWAGGWRTDDWLSADRMAAAALARA